MAIKTFMSKKAKLHEKSYELIDPPYYKKSAADKVFFLVPGNM